MDLKNRYDKWVDEGKPELAARKIDQRLHETHEMGLEDDNTNLPALVACKPICTSTPNTVTIHGKKDKIALYFLSDDSPSEMKPRNQFQSSSGTLIPCTRSFKEMVLKKSILCKHLKPVDNLRNDKE